MLFKELKVVTCVAVLLLIFSTCSQCLLPCFVQQQNLANGTCPNSTYPCFDFCSEQTIEGEKNCSAADHCCFRNNTCILKQLETPPDEEKTGEGLGEELFENANNDARSLGLGLPLDQFKMLFPHVPVCLKFPSSCKISYNSPEDLQPPVNIPYCQRIPCRLDNPFLDIDPNACFANPGCAFDYALYTYRNAISQAYLPAVPVCHLAIRNNVFLNNAKQYVNQSGSAWNPLLTKCLINELHDQIFTETNGCARVKVLQQLGHFAKRAGWSNILPQECYLINGCWSDNGCYYPLPEDNIKTKPKNEEPHFDAISYGRPMCLHMSQNLRNRNFLDGYHACLRSGCYADVDKNQLMLHLFEFANSVPLHIRAEFLKLVVSGQARADNYRFVLERLGFRDAILNSLAAQGISSSAGDARSVDTSVDNLLTNEPGTSVLFNNVDILGSFSNFTNPSLDNNSFVERSLNSLGVLNVPSKQPAKTLCPYQALKWPNFPKLKGSFEGCCESSFCYLPRSIIRNAHSEIASYTAPWTNWSPCSVSCNSGVQTRTQYCIGESCDKFSHLQHRECDQNPCPVYTTWSTYGPCSATCGGGTKTRYRQCLHKDSCTQELQETITCYTGRCPTMKPERWSNCNVMCGVGVRRRNMTCILPGDYGCPSKQMFEEKPCEQFCGTYRLVKSPCDTNTCQISLSVQCLLRDGKPGHCRRCRSRPITRKRKCFTGRCRCFYQPGRRECRRN